MRLVSLLGPLLSRDNGVVVSIFILSTEILAGCSSLGHAAVVLRLDEGVTCKDEPCDADGGCGHLVIHDQATERKDYPNYRYDPAAGLFHFLYCESPHLNAS